MEIGRSQAGEEGRGGRPAGLWSCQQRRLNARSGAKSHTSGSIERMHRGGPQLLSQPAIEQRFASPAPDQAHPAI